MANTKITTSVIADGAITSAKLDTDISVSGSITGTLATAAQPNITSVGTLTGFTSTGIDDNADATAITIDSSENVGINNTQATAINNASGLGNLVVGSGSGAEGITIYSGSDSYGGLNFADATSGGGSYAGYIKFNHVDNSFGHFIGNTERMRISSGGDISFYEDTGTTAKFFWDASAEALAVGGTNTFTSKIVASAANGTAYTSNPQLRISGGATNNNRASIIFSDDALSDGKISYYPHVTEASRLLSLSARTTESDFVIKGNGNVGIGTTSPTGGKLHVVGDVFAEGGSYFVGANGVVASDSTLRDLNFAIGNTTPKMTLDSSGNVSITDGNLTVANGHGIDFSATSGTGTSELLDDYEEGTWTPASGTTGITIQGTPSGTYTKIGRIVYYTLALKCNRTGSGSTQVVIAGLPFSGTGGILQFTRFEPTGIAFQWINGSTSGTGIYLTRPGGTAPGTSGGTNNNDGQVFEIDDVSSTTNSALQNVSAYGWYSV